MTRTTRALWCHVSSPASGLSAFWLGDVDEWQRKNASSLKSALAGGAGFDQVALYVATQRSTTAATVTDSNRVCVAGYTVLQIIAAGRDLGSARRGPRPQGRERGGTGAWAREGLGATDARITPCASGVDATTLDRRIARRNGWSRIDVVCLRRPSGRGGRALVVERFIDHEERGRGSGKRMRSPWSAQLTGRRGANDE